MHQAERRHFPRFPFHSKGALRVGEETVEGLVIDLSRVGALFQAKTPLASIGAPCELVVFHVGHTEFFVTAGHIARIDGDLLGIAFPAIDEAAEAALRQIADLNLAPHRLLHRDFATLTK